MHCKMFSTIPGFNPVGASSTHPYGDNQNASRSYQMSPGAKLLLVKNNCCRENVSMCVQAEAIVKYWDSVTSLIFGCFHIDRYIFFQEFVGNALKIHEAGTSFCRGTTQDYGLCTDSDSSIQTRLTFLRQCWDTSVSEKRFLLHRLLVDP